MKISTKGRYALRMMIDLCMHCPGGFAPLKEISSRQAVSKKYLEQIVPSLVRAGLLKTVRGNQGGYSLSRDPGLITVLDVLSAAEGVAEPNTEEEFTGFIWEELDRLEREYLSSITVEDIVSRNGILPEYSI
ncbi:MAG: Rrf2 family transcriptional regulator [Oscillospiraceae bacterium]|nr:Rrf2 family transcriptional regulator [Oscillospiraceae bacterium]